MIKTQLMMAMDFAKRKNVKPESYSYRRGGVWYIVDSGAGYSNTFQVVEYDDEGLKLLKRHERKEESNEAARAPEMGSPDSPGG